jgi:hypothetical protein
VHIHFPFVKVLTEDGKYKMVCERCGFEKEVADV